MAATLQPIATTQLNKLSWLNDERRFEQHFFDQFDLSVSPDARAVVGQVMAWTEATYYEKPSAMILMGTTGSGKTSLALAAMAALEWQEFETVRLDWPATISDIHQRFSAGKGWTPNEIDGWLFSYAVLIDDLGAEQVSEAGKWIGSVYYRLFELLSDTRFNFIVTTNLTIKEFKERLSDRAYSRLMDRVGLSNFVDMSAWKDYRLARAVRK